ncbi:aldehyde dehydrogenase [Adhaeribacter aerolatus]|uniref:Aldehyde dehydrogenase n=1 Tax=Adhaeribacter aerolatus TaxID=670289 RepID=A0A512ATW1_9BACT|nr:aldehyde dehydrogenase family protein [Adhaeribacter aerolatus]GEO03113.1 aldehyde dehydrogenase [Adhaeribacter aerolatus]
MAKVILPEAAWDVLLKKLKNVTPEIFDNEGRILNLIAGEWKNPGRGRHYFSSIDGTELGKLPMLSLHEGYQAVKAAAAEYDSWQKVSLDNRKDKVKACLDLLRENSQLLAYLLTWEIGKPYQQSMVSVDRCITGVEWYLENIDSMLAGRKPLGLISNIASWNYPMSVLMHAMLVQALAGNSVIAKTPTDGGLFSLSLACALARRCGIPVSLISGSGGELSDALIHCQEVSALSYVGGKSHGRGIALSLLDTHKRHMLEMEGVNAYGIWDYDNWEELAGQIKKGFEYGKQRCTAYVRWVVQRELFPKFLDTYIPAIKSLKVGNPLLVEEGQTELPKLDIGPLINTAKVEELRGYYGDALGKGAIGLYKGELDESMFTPNQDISAYFAPATLLNVSRGSHLYYNEPFGPLDTILVVDSVDEMIAEMNVSNGNLVSSVATDNKVVAGRMASELRSFKVGINKVRSRGDKEETFGGLGQSWKGCFVGGKYLVYAVTQGPANEKLPGNFPDYTLLP